MKWASRSQVLQNRAFQDGCGATRNRQSQLGNGFQGICCCQGCVFPLTSLSSPVCLRSSRLFTSCVSAAFLRISPDLIFLSFLFFFDKQPAACSLPIHFIHILFPCKKTPAFLHSAPPPPNTNSCCAFALIIPQTRRAEERRLHLAP